MHEQRQHKKSGGESGENDSGGRGMQGKASLAGLQLDTRRQELDEGGEMRALLKGKSFGPSVQERPRRFVQ